MEDARKDLSNAWRFAIAYTAALRLCGVVLSAAGYRAAREQKQYRTIAVLPLIMGQELTGAVDLFESVPLKTP